MKQVGTQLGGISVSSSSVGGPTVLPHTASRGVRASVLRAQSEFLGLIGAGVLPLLDLVGSSSETSAHDLGDPSQRRNPKFVRHGLPALITPESFGDHEDRAVGDYLGITQEVLRVVRSEGVPLCPQCRRGAKRWSLAMAVKEIEVDGKGSLMLLAHHVTPVEENQALTRGEIAEMFDSTKVIIEGQLHSLRDVSGEADTAGAFHSPFLVVLTSYAMPLSHEDRHRFNQDVASFLGREIHSLEVCLMDGAQVVRSVSIAEGEFFCEECAHGVSLEEGVEWMLHGESLDSILARSMGKAIELCGSSSERLNHLYHLLRSGALDDVSGNVPLRELSSGERVRLRLVELLIDGFSDGTVVIDDGAERGESHERALKLLTERFHELQQTEVYVIGGATSSTVQSPTRLRGVGIPLPPDEDRVSLRAGALNWIIGESSSGKSILLRAISRTLSRSAMVVTPQKHTSPSNRIADHAGITEEFIAELVKGFEARREGITPLEFSRHRGPHRCPQCHGEGWRAPDTGDEDLDALVGRVLPEYVVACPTCSGVGIVGSRAALTLRDISYSDLMRLRVREARTHLSIFKEIAVRLDAIAECGGGEWVLGSSLSSLSGEERGRLEVSNLVSRILLRREGRGRRSKSYEVVLIDLDTLSEDLVEVLRPLAAKSAGMVLTSSHQRFLREDECSILLTHSMREWVRSLASPSRSLRVTWQEKR